MTEIGEGLAMSRPSNQEDWKLEAEIVGIRFLSPIQVALDNQKVTGPHWTLGQRKKIRQDWSKEAKKLGLPRWVFFSKRPAVVAVTQSGPEVEVEVEVVRSKNVGARAKLTGRLGSFELQGACPTSVGRHKIRAKIANKPSGIERYAGQLEWGLQVEPPGASVGLNPTMLEVFFILDQPGKMYDPTGVPAEALRFLTLKVGLRGESDAKNAAVKIARYFHSKHKVRYDVKKGKTHYDAFPPSGSIVSFQLLDYIFRKDKKVNCYDQAASVQSLCGAVGIHINWIFMDPYGFINPTRLVGRRGLINNPFYQSSYPHKKMIDPNDPQRTAFGNHAFCEYRSKIYDACAGPHAGNEDLASYIKAAIDHTTTLNSRYRGLPGKTTDAYVGPGVEGTK